MGHGPFSNYYSSQASFQIYKKPKIPILSALKICKGSSITLGLNGVTTSNPPLSYSWSPISTINLPQSVRPVASPLLNTTYQLKVKDAAGCSANAFQQVNVLPPTYSSFNRTVCNNLFYYFNNHYLNSSGIYYDTITNYKNCDSIITLNLTVLPTSVSYSNSYQTICTNQFYIFSNHQLNLSGIYYDTLINAANCDSIITLNLNVIPDNSSFTQAICANQFYTFNNHQLNQTGIYYDTLQNYVGCDSFITLNLIVNPISNNSFTQNICIGSSYNFNGNNLTTAGIYYDTLQNYFGCDSFIILHLNVNQPTSKSINQTICSNQFYTFNNHKLNTAGTYFDTLQNYVGCDSFITLHLIVNSISSSSYYQTICSNQPFLFNNHNLNQTGTYHDTLQNYLGCDSLITLNLNVKPISNYSFTQTICSNQFYSFNNQNLNQTGIYFDTLQNYAGCDSFITLNLIVNPISNNSFTQNICAGSTFNFNGNNLTIPGIYYDTLQNYLGCDSFITLHLNVNQPTSKIINQTICNNQSYNLNGTILTQSGTYYDTIQNHFGCDSFITLHLIVNPISSYSFNKTICSDDFYLFNNHQLFFSGIYNDTFINHNGCDSFITLHLTVLPSSNKTIYQTICGNNPFLFNGHLLNSTGKYYDTLTNYLGCDSVITLRLTALPSFNYNSTTLTFCEGSPYFYNGHVYTTNTQLYDTFQTQMGCDSIVGIKIITIPAPDTTVVQSGNALIAQAQHSSFYWYDCMQHQLIQNANDDTFKINHSGTYAVIVKDSLTLCSDTSNCRMVVISGVDEQFTEGSGQLVVYPNPCGDKLLVMSDKLLVNTIEVKDVLGRTQMVRQAHHDSDVLAVYSPLKRGQGGLEIDTENLPSGIYFIKATDAKGNIWNGKFVKE